MNFKRSQIVLRNILFVFTMLFLVLLKANFDVKNNDFKYIFPFIYLVDLALVLYFFNNYEIINFKKIILSFFAFIFLFILLVAIYILAICWLANFAFIKMKLIHLVHIKYQLLIKNGIGIKVFISLSLFFLAFSVFPSFIILNIYLTKKISIYIFKKIQILIFNKKVLSVLEKHYKFTSNLSSKFFKEKLQFAILKKNRYILILKKGNRIP